MPSPHQVLVTASQLGQTSATGAQRTKDVPVGPGQSHHLSQSRVSHLELNAQDLSVAQLLAWCSALELELTLRHARAWRRLRPRRTGDMGRKSHSCSLSIWTNGMRVGRWTLPARGDMQPRYDDDWIKADVGWPLSISLPFTLDKLPLKGEKVCNWLR
jgi:hypothetical protein